MHVTDLTIEELKEIKARLDKGERFGGVVFSKGITEWDALMDRLTKEVGYQRKDYDHLYE